jgi:ferredoxin
MHDYLRKTRTEIAVRRKWLPAAYTMAEGWNVIPRANPPMLESGRRAASLETIELRFAEGDARRQGARCLRCNVNTVFDTSICVACNGCVDVCPENLIRLMGLSQLLHTDHWMAPAAADFGMSEQEFQRLTPEQMDQLGAVMLKDETTCIRCSLCASRCPTHAITMKEFAYYTECVPVPSPNPKIHYQAATG